jgi:DNA-binding helix-hairpin-helix protein with protein kinase domain
MAPVQIKPLYDSAGGRVLLTKRIGGGGEGDVYGVHSPLHHDVVAKIYHKPLSAEKQEKLLLMARGCNDELKAISAWPTDVLSSRPGGPVVGFLMPKIEGCEPVHKVYGPTHRKEIFPNADWRFLVRTAKNLAAAFYVIHKFGYVIGDVNEGNILVSDKACVRLIDCDSFQVRNNDRLFYCEVGVAQFTPPEIQKSKNFHMERTPNHDNFGLAILIFQLLFLGRHPYSGVYEGKEDMPLEKAIAGFRFAYSAKSRIKQIAPPPNSVGLAIVPGQVAGLFEDAFAESGVGPGSRPVAGDWWDALTLLEARMRQCSADSVHYHYSGLAQCPWCTLEEKSGLLLFLSTDRISKIDLRREWQKVEAIVQPGPLPRVSPDRYQLPPAPLPRGIERALDLRVLRQFAGVGVIAVCIVLTLGEVITDFTLLLPVALVILVLFLYPGGAAAEMKRRRSGLRTARHIWELWYRKWTTEAGDVAFNKELSHIRELKLKYESIDREYRNELVALEKNKKDRQQQKFLEHCSVDDCPVPGLSADRKRALRAAGILSAADITQKKLYGIPQFDNTLINQVLAWRDRMEKNFLFNPKLGIDPSDLLSLVHKYQPMVKPVERDLVQGIRKLRRVQDDIIKKRALLQPTVERRAKELAQAEADFAVFSRIPEELVRRDIDWILHPGSYRR